jgi:two-component system sensor histidine kinase RegB
MAPSNTTQDNAHAIHRINMSWLVRLRWAAILGQSVVIGYVRYRLDIAVPMAPLAVILGLELVMNVGFELWLSREPLISEPALALAMAADVSTFTALLYFTGGPLNPFSFLYLVHIALAAVVLRPVLAWTLLLFSLGANGALFLKHVPLPMHHGDMSMMMMHHAMQMGASSEPLDMHLRGMWVAFAVAAGFIVYFIHRVTRALAEREGELRRTREVAVRSEKLASMVTLAAGAAHELATPLSTIAIAASELARLTEPDFVAADARLIRAQVDRCRDILGQMAGGAGVTPGEMATEASLSEIVRIALDGLPTPERIAVEWRDGAAQSKLVVPPRATAQALRNVLKNALDASGPSGGGTWLTVARLGPECRLEIGDHGTGMSEEVLARATEPFFTTKEAGHGMGLGLFLTRSVVGQLGGTLNIDSELGKGTRVVMTLPSV